MRIELQPRLVLLLGFPSALASDIGHYIQQGLSPLPSTGSGDVFASSCQSALWAWQTSSSSFGLLHTTFALTTAPRYATGPPSVSASSVTVLCDGYSRAIGSASTISRSQTGSSTYTAVGVLGPYPTPPPCSIDQNDCALLYSSYSTAASSLIGSNKTLLAPPCNTNGSDSITFSSTYCMGSGKNGVVGVRGTSVRLLYWPVRTSSADNSAYFCTQSEYSLGASPLTIPATRTGSGPNTFVTGTLTITSPTIALSYSDLSRIDGCGTTIAHTIITMSPEELSSVRGGRSLYDLRPFNYGDLNWMCPSRSNSSHFTVQDLEGPNCYQNVPAQAYWNAAQRFDLAMYVNVSQIQQWTIVNNYEPYVLPAQHVWTETMHRLWGTSAVWHIDGSWDPPIALSEAASVAKPTLPSPYSAQPTTDSPTRETTAMTTTPTPAYLGDTLPSSTAEIQQATPSASGFSNEQHESSGALPQGQGDHQDTPSLGSSEVVIGTKTISLTWASASGAPGLDAILGSETLSFGGAVHTVDGDLFSAASTGLVLVEESPSVVLQTQESTTRSSTTSSIISTPMQTGSSAGLPPVDSSSKVSSGSRNPGPHSSGTGTTLRITSAGNTGSEPSGTAIENSGIPCRHSNMMFALLVSILVFMV